MSATTGGRIGSVPPEMPSGHITVPPPPGLRAHEGASGIVMNAIPMLGSLGSIVLIANTGAASSGRTYLAVGIFVATTVGFVIVQLERQRRQRCDQVTGPRTAYLRHLALVRTTIRDAGAQQRRALTWRHPPPTSLPALALEGSRRWERTRDDPEHLRVRYGLGSQPLALDLVVPDPSPSGEADPVAAEAMRRLVDVHRLQRHLPAVIDLRAHDLIDVRGPQPQTRALARAVVCSATTFHGPDDLVLAVLAAPAHLAHWEWVKWLPHARCAHTRDAVGPRRLVATSLDELRDLLAYGASHHPPDGTGAPHVLIVADTDTHPPDLLAQTPGLGGVTVLAMSAPGRPHDGTASLRVEFDDDPRSPRVRLTPLGSPSVEALADQCPSATAEALARRLAPAYACDAPSGHRAGDLVASVPDQMALLGLDDVGAFDPATAWLARPAASRLRVPIGLGDDGRPVHLDLKESAQQGMGPHGMVIGATGSGKSEFLRTLVLGLAMTHPPAVLNMVLVDFKGGATFAPLADLPHVSAVITNLAQELTLLDRMQDALSGEMVRRQELLRSAGNHASIHDYERARASGVPLEPMPALFIVVDEFSEMLSVKPEFIDLFAAIGRLGRSLGLHLLLASQRLDEGRLRGLESHLSYRVGLRTFSAAESRTVLGVPDAYELPTVPGLGYLKVDQSTLVRFKAAYVSGPPTPRTPTGDGGGCRPRILPYSTRQVGLAPAPVSQHATVQPADGATGPEVAGATVLEVAGATVLEVAGATVLEVAVGAMTGHGTPARSVWLAPLDRPDTLDALMGDLAADPRLGLVSQRWRDEPGLVVPLGAVDRPREQRRDTLTLDLAGAGGHVAVVGGPRSGKSTVLRSLLASLGLTRTPLEVQVFVLDFGGGAFAPMARFPHVAGVATRAEPDVVRRVVAQVRSIVERREAYFREHHIDSMQTYRTLRSQGRADDGWGEVCVLVDGWSTLRAEFDDLETELGQLAVGSLTFGVHLLTATARWADYRPSLRELFGTRLELRLGDPLDSEVDRKVAALVPAGRPGRGLLSTGQHFLAVLPRIDADPTPDTVASGVEHLIDRVEAAWPGPPGPTLRLLPEMVPLATVREEAQRLDTDAALVVLGVDERELAPLTLDVAAEPHLVVFGDAGSGKSALLRTYLHEVIGGRTPQQAQVMLVDYRRSALGEVPEAYLLDHLVTQAQAEPALRELADHLHRRLPGPGVTSEQLRARSWWEGPDVFVVVDDYDLVATQHSSPLLVLQPLLAQARDVGLHLVVARRAGGASRSLYEPVLQTLRDLAAPGVLLSGPTEEGPLIGAVRPRPAPPGRAQFVTRDRGVEVAQLAWSEPTW